MEFESAIKKKKNLWIFFQKYGFIRKIEPFHSRMKHNIIQMTATADLIVHHLINLIFQYIFDCLGFNPMNNIFGFVFQDLNRLWMVSVTLILNLFPQKIVQRGQITAPGGQLTSEFRLIIRFSKTVRKRSVVTLAVWQVAPSCWNQMSTMSSSLLNGGSLLIIEEKWPNDVHRTKIRTKQSLVVGASASQWWRLDFLSPKFDNFVYWPNWPFAQSI